MPLWHALPTPRAARARARFRLGLRDEKAQRQQRQVHEVVRVQGDEREGPEGVPQGLQALPQVRCFDRRHKRGRDGVSFLPLRIRMPPKF
jgi:hypothetical protein